MFSEIPGKILALYREYIGSGCIGALFFAAVFYLLFGEKVKARRLVLGVLPLVLAAFFACPVFDWIVSQYLDEEIYYRFLWLLPVTLVIAYAGVKLVLGQTGIRRLVTALAVCGVIMVCGDYVYDNPYFTVAQNAYHVPQTVADICDEIQVPGREVRAVFPADMVQYVRQYSPYVCLAFGREMTVERWMIGNEMYEAYELGLPDGVVRAKTLAETARKYAVHYIIWDEKRAMEGELTDWGFSLQKEVDGYLIYLDEEVYLGL